jgi:hypothetical protein
MKRLLCFVALAALGFARPADAQTVSAPKPKLPTFTLEKLPERPASKVFIENSMSVDLSRQKPLEPWQIVRSSAAPAAIDCAMVKTTDARVIDPAIARSLPSGIDFKTPTVVAAPCKR